MQKTNRLINELSPYLNQHAHNPVDWYPWGPEAIEKARREDKPIFLSIGYSACHWCHVMERESFENEEIADILNRSYISIKVDREERPDLDEIYMDAVQLISGNGGWPMTVFLDTDLKPFYGGTYFPPENRQGRRGFREILLSLAEIWTLDRKRIRSATMEVFSGLSQSISTGPALENGELENLHRRACDAHAVSFDAVNGGFGGAPKFPPALQMLGMIQWEEYHRDGRYLDIIRKTLDGMACGGIYDHAGGGFCRYSVDEKWSVPHFEKMLTDNALLARVYLNAFQLVQEPLYREKAIETLDFVLRDMTDPCGGFYSSLDADSEGGEGVFYLWNAAELDRITGNASRSFREHFHIRDNGNFLSPEPAHQGMNILYSSNLGTPADVRRALAQVFEHRKHRKAPRRDEKIITSWNSLMIQTMAETARVTGEKRFENAALKAGNFIAATMMKDGQLMRINRGHSISQPALLEDWAFWGNACVELYELDGNRDWLNRAVNIAETIWSRFQSDGILYITESDVPFNIVRKQSLWDSVIPSGSSATALLLFSLFKRTGDRLHDDRFDLMMRSCGGILKRAPGAMCVMTTVADLRFRMSPV